MRTTSRVDHKRYALSLPPIALSYLRVRSLIEVAVFVAVGLISVMLWAPDPWRWPLVGTVVALALLGLLIDVPFMNRWIVRNTSYEVSDDVVRIRRGILLSRDLTISSAQILTVSVVTGPILRRYGLAKVVLTTIAHTDPLGPLTVAEAEAVRHRILGVFESETVTT